MIKRTGAILLALALTGALFAQAKPATDPKQTEIIIAAAASLTDALNEAIALYGKTDTSVKIIPTYGSSGALQQQIEQGAPVDIFFSAATKQIKALDDKGLLVSASKKEMLRNSLVLVTPSGKTTIASFADAGTDKVKQIALGEISSVPAGQYAIQVFTALGIADAVKAKAVYAKDVRQVLAYVEEVDAGVVYATDAAISKKVRVAAKAPEGTSDPVSYPAALVKAGTKQKEAQKFLDWLSGPEADAIFTRYGFIVP